TQGTIATDVQLSGRVASMGRGIIQDVSARIVDQFSENLAAMLSGPAAAPAPAEAAAPGEEPAGGPAAAAAATPPPAPPGPAPARGRRARQRRPHGRALARVARPQRARAAQPEDLRLHLPHRPLPGLQLGGAQAASGCEAPSPKASAISS